MKSFHWNHQMVAAAVAVVAIASFAGAQDKQVGSEVVPGTPPQILTIQVPGATEPVSNSFVVDTVDDSADVSAGNKYWVGLNCTPVGDALRSHLKIADGQGLLVLDVVAKSPADKAKLKRHDILLKFGKVDVSAVSDLARAVQETGPKPVELQIIRAGKRRSIKITPAERSKDSARIRGYLRLDPDGGGKVSKEVLELLRKHGLGKQGAVRARFFGPGVELPKRGTQSVEIRIEKTGTGKARITVTKDGKTMTTTADNLKKLPKDVRPMVERALKAKQGGKGLRFDFKVDGRKFSPKTHGVWIQRWQGGPWGRFQWMGVPGQAFGRPQASRIIQMRVQGKDYKKQLEQINKKLDLLQKTLDQMKPKKK
ncbi:MAG: PDZ domain-containing protein [Planctomycetaceae bacterium]